MWLCFCVPFLYLIQNLEMAWKFVKWIFYNTDLFIGNWIQFYLCSSNATSLLPSTRTILLLQIAIRYLYRVDIVASLISNFEWYYNVIYLNAANNKKNSLLSFSCELNFPNFLCLWIIRIFWFIIYAHIYVHVQCCNGASAIESHTFIPVVKKINNAKVAKIVQKKLKFVI